MNPTVIIQARTGSVRLPRKILADINGKMLLEHVIERASAIRGIAGLIVATTMSPEDDIVDFLTDKLKVACFRGSENDVLLRYYECAVAVKADPIIRITADCPLLNPEVSSQVLERWMLDPRHFLHNCGPGTDGWDTEVIPFSMLKKSHERATSPEHREHVTMWAKEHMRSWVRHVQTATIPSGAKWSVDTEADLIRVREAYAVTCSSTQQARVPSPTTPADQVQR